MPFTKPGPEPTSRRSPKRSTGSTPRCPNRLRPESRARSVETFRDRDSLYTGSERGSNPAGSASPKARVPPQFSKLGLPGTSPNRTERIRG